MPLSGCPGFIIIPLYIIPICKQIFSFEVPHLEIKNTHSATTYNEIVYRQSYAWKSW